MLWGCRRVSYSSTFLLGGGVWAKKACIRDAKSKKKIIFVYQQTNSL